MPFSEIGGAFREFSRGQESWLLKVANTKGRFLISPISDALLCGLLRSRFSIWASSSSCSSGPPIYPPSYSPQSASVRHQSSLTLPLSLIPLFLLSFPHCCSLTSIYAATGLYYIAEIVEDYERTTRKVIKYTIWVRTLESFYMLPQLLYRLFSDVYLSRVYLELML